MCERVIEGSVDAAIEGNVEVRDRKMAELLKKQNELLDKQNEILQELVHILRWKK